MSQLRGLGFCLTVFCVGEVEAATFRVKTTGTGDGTNWTTAPCSLQYALDQAVAGDEIWVQQGTYYRDAISGPVMLNEGVKLYGGFQGNEFLAKQSNPATRVTIIDGSDAVECVWSEGTSSATVIRGFTLQHGLSDGLDFGVPGHLKGGGGIHLFNSSLKVVRCVIKNNNAFLMGGGIAIQHIDSEPQFVNCEIRDNGYGTVEPVFGGGGVAVYAGSPTFTNCLIHNNHSYQGGAVFVRTGYWGPGYVVHEAFPVFINCTITRNTDLYGEPGITDGEGLAVFRNCIIWGNSADGMHELVAPYWANVLRYTDISGYTYYPGGGNIHVDPLFVNPAANNFRLQGASPCVNTGSNAELPSDIADLDWDGNLNEQVPCDLDMKTRAKWGRIQVDRGCYEYDVPGGGGGLD